MLPYPPPGQPVRCYDTDYSEQGSGEKNQMIVRAFIAWVAMALPAFAHPIEPPKVAADLILVNAKIWTVDRERPEVEAVACWQGRILALGTTTEIRTLAGPKTVVIDARGRRVAPGFHDSHLHLLGSGLR